jgi:hypothetical protein
MNPLSIRGLRWLLDPYREGSPTNKLRRRRLRLLDSLLEHADAPASILDVGGNPEFWRNAVFTLRPGDTVTLLNLEARPLDRAGFSSIVGDARDLSRFSSGSFDVVFSNSVIEHVGTAADQARMAAEIRRVGRSFLVQTPNRRFFIEPHFLWPLFQFYPREMKVFLLTRFELGWYHKQADADSAKAIIDSTRLLSRHELKRLFPDADIVSERVAGFAKSLIAIRRSPPATAAPRHSR